MVEYIKPKFRLLALLIWKELLSETRVHIGKDAKASGFFSQHKPSSIVKQERRIEVKLNVNACVFLGGGVML